METFCIQFSGLKWDGHSCALSRVCSVLGIPVGGSWLIVRSTATAVPNCVCLLRILLVVVDKDSPRDRAKHTALALIFCNPPCTEHILCVSVCVSVCVYACACVCLCLCVCLLGV